MTVTTAGVAARSLVPEPLFDRLTNRIAMAHGVPHALAARIMDQALAFLATCATRRDSGLAPAASVDLGWHTFILYTREYTEFCDRIAGGYIHHVPVDGRGDGTTFATDRQTDVTRSAAAIASAGFMVDQDLWSATAANCNSGDDGCRASGKDGNENTDTNGR